MVIVTERAAAELQEVLRHQNASEGEGIKLIPGDDGQVQMTIAPPNIGDEVTQMDGQPLLIVDASLTNTLEGAEVDFATESANGTSPPGFTIKPA
jgi:Fe-S cluster assembly iron-binding protein IscA